MPRAFRVAAERLDLLWGHAAARVKEIARWDLSVIRAIDQALGESAGKIAQSWLTLRARKVFKACGEPKASVDPQKLRDERKEAAPLDALFRCLSERDQLLGITRARGASKFPSL